MSTDIITADRIAEKEWSGAVVRYNLDRRSLYVKIGKVSFQYTQGVDNDCVAKLCECIDRHKISGGTERIVIPTFMIYAQRRFTVLQFGESTWYYALPIELKNFLSALRDVRAKIRKF